MYTLPSTWPRTSTGFKDRPISWPIQILGISIQPVVGSTSTSMTQAVYEYVGDGPTPPDLYFAADGGGLYEPTVPSVPCSASPSTTASRKGIPTEGSCASN